MGASYIHQLYSTERQVVETFRLARAVTPDSAIVPPAWSARAQRQIFARFARKRALVPTAGGRYYLDEARWAEYSTTRSRGFLIYCASVVVIVIVLIVMVP